MNKRLGIILTLVFVFICCFCCSITLAAVLIYRDNLTVTTSQSIQEITLERSPCFGFCPSYSLTLKSDGKVSFDDTGFNTSKVGKKEYSISPDKFLQIAAEVDKVDFFNLKDEYVDNRITDLPGTNITVKSDGKTKTIKMYGLENTVPQILTNLADKIDEIAGVKELLK